jgi:DnaJ-class molecular chaperone
MAAMHGQKEYYAILGIQRGAGQDQIRAGYRREALKWHPQRNPNDLGEATVMFALVAEAYDVLADLQKKSIYDEYGLQVFQEGTLCRGQKIPGYQYVGDPLKMFQEFFASDSAFVPLTTGDAGLGMKRREPPRTIEPPLELELQVSLEEIYTGCTRLVKYTRTRLADDRTSTVNEETTLTVEVGQGWQHGTCVQFEQAGNQLHPQIKQGPVRLKIVVTPHAHFKRSGLDLLYTHRLDLYEALTGHVIHIPLLDGQIIAVPVPEITTSTDSKRVAGRGMATAKGQGDLVVQFEIAFPKELSQKQKDELKRILRP